MRRTRQVVLGLAIALVLALGLMPSFATADDAEVVAGQDEAPVEQLADSQGEGASYADGSDSADDSESMPSQQEGGEPEDAAVAEDAADASDPDAASAGWSEGDESGEEVEELAEQGSDGYYNIETSVSGSGSGTISVDESADYGDQVHYFVWPDSENVVTETYVEGADGTQIDVYLSGDYGEYREYYFYMPDGDVTICAVFDPIPHFNVTTQAAGTGSGTVEITSDTTEPACGDTVSYAATAKTHNRIKSISLVKEDGTTESLYDRSDYWYPDDYQNYDGEFEMSDCDVVIFVEFEPVPRVDKKIAGSQYGTVTITSGTMYPNLNSYSYVSFTAKPKPDCRLAKLYVKTANGATYTVGNGNLWKKYYYNNDNEYEFNMPDCVVTINATFEPIPHYAIYKNYVGGSNGTVTIIGDGATLYPHAGDKVRFRTSPKTGYTLTRMSYTTASGKTMALTRTEGSGKAGTNSVYEFTMPAENVTLNATFAENHRFIDKVINGSGQLMLVDNGSGKATMYPKPGDKVRFKAIPASGFRLTNCNYTLSETGKTLALSKVAGTTNIYEFTMPNEDVTLGGRFIPVKAVWRSDGRYVVGKDIPAGVYVFMGTVQYADWDTAHEYPRVRGHFECLKRTDDGWSIFRYGYLNDDDNPSQRNYAEVKDGEVIQITEGAIFAFADYATPLNTKTLTKDGWYRVGVDCPAGLYRLTENDNSSANARYEVDPWVGTPQYGTDYDRLHKYATVLSAQNVRVESGQYLYIEGCTAKWLKA